MRLLPISHYQCLQIFLLLLQCATTSLALDFTDLQQTFQLHDQFNGQGGCGRKAPNGKGMLPYTVTAISDAFQMASAVQSQINSYRLRSPSSKRLRALFYLFFGITFGSKNEMNEDKAQNYTYVKAVFSRVNLLLAAPNPDKDELPWLHCLEDYAFFTEHMIGSDGKENLSAPLAAHEYDLKDRDGNYFLGVMWAPIFSSYYEPRDSKSRYGQCGNGDTVAFTKWGPSVVGWGITLCPKLFGKLNLVDVKESAATSPMDLIDDIVDTAGMTVLHEMFHLISRGEIIDQPCVVPPNGIYINRDPNWLPFSAWITDENDGAYGYTESLYLGLARPLLGLQNAENYAIFAMCLAFPNLDCVGTYGSAIAKREMVPFQPAPEAVKAIQQGRSILQ